MSRFLLLFVGRAAPDQPAPDDSETQAYMRQWTTWLAQLASAGTLESSLPLQPTGTTVTKDSVSAYELAEVDINAFMLITAASLDEANAIAAQAPHIALGGTTIVR